MIRLVYASRAVGEWHTGSLILLLDAARDRNAELGVTGALVHGGGVFLQQLEGDETAVQALFEKISADRRHTDVQVLERCAITERTFPSWAMGFDDPAAKTLAEYLPGYDPELLPTLRTEAPAPWTQWLGEDGELAAALMAGLPDDAGLAHPGGDHRVADPRVFAGV